MRTLIASTLAFLAFAAPQEPAGPAATVTERFLARSDEPIVGYRAKRRLEANNARFKKDGWLEAETALVGGRFTWQEVSSGGSSYIINKVLRPVLAAEAEALSIPRSSGALTPANYNMFDEPRLADGPLRIRLKPKRKDTLLVDGWIVVSPDEADLMEITGRLTKTPSFWTTSVEIHRAYARIAGRRVPVSVESTASVRIAGPSTFRMTYRYDEIDGVRVAQPVGVSARGEIK